MLDAFEHYLGATPWAPPVLAVTAIGLALSARRIAARTGWPAWLTMGFGLSLAGFLGVTATPDSDLDLGLNGARFASWTPHLPSFHELAQIIDPWDATEPALNAWLAMPLGLTAAVATVRMRAAWPAVIAIIAPFAAEWVQWSFPGFDRAAFLFGDVTANWFGVAIGAAGGLVIATAWMAIRRRRPQDLGERIPAWFPKGSRLRVR